MSESFLKVFDPKPVTLEGEVVRLEPLSLAHASDLLQAALDPTTWRYMPMAGFANLEELHNWILNAQTSGDVAFAIVVKETGLAAGSTRYMDIRREHRGLEIGWTWLAPGVQRTRVNTEAKYLLLKHAFEELRALRVQLKTDSRNIRSQRAIERIGGVMEGVHRRHMQAWDGHLRDTVFYSIIDTEWPAVKERFQLKLAAPMAKNG